MTVWDFLDAIYARLRTMNRIRNDHLLLRPLIAAILAISTRGEVTERKMEKSATFLQDKHQMAFNYTTEDFSRIYSYLGRVIVKSNIPVGEVMSNLAGVFSIEISLRVSISILQASGAGASGLNMALSGFRAFMAHPVWTFLHAQARPEMDAFKEASRVLARNQLIGYGTHAQTELNTGVFSLLKF
jgi:hypothetical protein